MQAGSKVDLQLMSCRTLDAASTRTIHWRTCTITPLHRKFYFNTVRMDHFLKSVWEHIHSSHFSLNIYWVPTLDLILSLALDNGTSKWVRNSSCPQEIHSQGKEENIKVNSKTHSSGNKIWTKCWESNQLYLWVVQEVGKYSQKKKKKKLY